MATFKITKTTTVAKLKKQFRDEFGGTLRVYDGRSEAPDTATLVSLGGKVGELECRASRTVGKFIEAFQSELGLKVKVYTPDNWVSVLDGITLATVKEIPNGSTKAKMKEFLAYQRDEDSSAESPVVTNDYPLYSEAAALFKVGDKSNRYTLSDDGKTVNEISDALEGPLVVPEGVETVVFDTNDCIEGLTAIIMPDSVTTMEGWLNCHSCENLQYLRLSPNIKTIPKRAFYALKMEELVIPEGIEVIEAEAFQSASLKKVVLPSTLKFILPSAFEGCNLTEVVIPANVKVIFAKAFRINYDLKVTFLSDETIVMPTAFEDCNIENEEDIYAQRPLGSHTFGIDEVTYGDVEQKNWKGVVTGVKRELTFIPPYYCGPLRIADGTQKYFDISKYPGITELYIPDSIENDCLYFPRGVEKLHVPSNIKNLRMDELENLKEFNIPESVTYIDISKSPIETLAIPEGVTDIYIEDMPEVKEIILPTSVTTISVGTCPKLEKLDVPSSVVEIGTAFLRGCVSLKSVKIPEGITSIPRRTATGDWMCGSMKFTELVIPSSVTEIGEDAFSNNDAIETVTIPASVKKILANAFSNCPNLKTVNIEGDPLCFPGAFDNTPGFKGKVISLPTTEFTPEGHPMVRLTVDQIFFKKNYYERASEFLDNDGYYGDCVVMYSKSADQSNYPLDKIGYLTYSTSASSGLSDFNDEDEDACTRMLGRGFFLVAHPEDDSIDYGMDIFENCAKALALILNPESGITVEDNPYEGPEAYFELKVKNFDSDEILHTFNYHLYKGDNDEWKVDTL